MSEQDAGGSTDRDPEETRGEDRPSGDVQEDYPKGQPDETSSGDEAD
jgi:hypothetical protein